MKRYIVVLLLIASTLGGAQAQKYRFQFKPAGCKDTVLYIGRHYRDAVQVVDTAYRQGRGGYVASGRREWPRGIYVLVRQDRESAMADFVVDDSRSFTLEGDSVLSTASIRVSGSWANAQMVGYMARLEQANREQDSLQRAGDKEGMARLNREMSAYVQRKQHEGAGNVFFQLVAACDNPEVPDTVQDKPRYCRDHYWDAFFGPATPQSLRQALLYSPQLFSKMNYYFFGMLYRANADTIKHSLDMLMERIGDDTAMTRYVLQFVEPRYYRSTKNIGWDAVWCHLVERYYLKGRCPWAKESELYVMEKNYKRIRQSIIGAHGQELWMLDTTQVESSEHWVSSHRFPERYVILWFWDPDCHHCQEQSEQLKVLYDSLSAAGAKRFEVYAVGYDSDVKKWKRYVREHDFRWVNVGGPNVNIDYQEAYNVHGAPTMIILNERRDIIMNKVLPVKDLMHWLDTYERIEGRKRQ